jgi:hypothetical protein
MKAHVLLNVLNHVDGQSEWDGGDLLTLPDGTLVSIQESAKTMQPGQSLLRPPLDAFREVEDMPRSEIQPTKRGGAWDDNT